MSVLVAEDGSGLVGMLGFVEFDGCVRDERVPGGWMTNWLVVPALRGRGLGLELVEHVLGSSYGLVGALAANSATRHVLGRYGFVEVGMHRWVRVFDLQALRELLAPRVYPEEAWSAWARASPRVAPRARPESFVGACRDEEHLRRRYEQHPRFRYELLREGGSLAAYRIETVEGGRARVMRIVDFLGGNVLAERLAEAARAEGVVFAEFACASPGFGAPLESAGFQREDRLPAELPGRFQPLDFSDRPIVSCLWAAPQLGLELPSADLYLTRSDSDLDRPA